ncbi:MAG: hypothetical protein OEU26_34845, partial [Candidatus Tectomicrobia bacterium]|nr:hypothetical protein [Candidatus Tectomicrobia bacterium]
NPYKLIFPISFLPLLYVLSIPLWIRIRKKIVKYETPNILYHSACERALDGKANESMILIEESVRKGYSNREHMIKDEDLESLRERQDFKELIDKMKQMD